MTTRALPIPPPPAPGPDSLVHGLRCAAMGVGDDGRVTMTLDLTAREARAIADVVAFGLWAVEARRTINAGAAAAEAEIAKAQLALDALQMARVARATDRQARARDVLAAVIVTAFLSDALGRAVLAVVASLGAAP